MIEKIKKINNPLTIIAIFAALAEINATIAIGLIDKELHSIFIWFVIGFPVLLVILFFATLNLNTKVMYSPSDFKDDKNFMASLHGKDYYDNTEESDTFNTNKLSTELEEKITENLFQKMNKTIKDPTNPQIQKEIDKLKNQIKNATNQTFVEVRSMYAIPTDLKEILLSFFTFPAYYMIIYAIVRSGATSIDKLKSLLKKYYLPGDWEKDGMPKLFEKKILEGNDDKFNINPKHKEHLQNWVDQNSNRLKAMNNTIRRADCDEEDNSKYTERINVLTKRLKF